MALESTRIVIRPFMLAIGKAVKKYRINLRLIINLSVKMRSITNWILGKDISIYD